MAVRPDVSYIPYSISPRGETGDIITSAQLEEGGLLSETPDCMKIKNESDDDSTMPPLFSEE